MGNGTRAHARTVVVYGSPGSGKARFVSQRYKAGDVVISLDSLAAAITGRPLCAMPKRSQMAYVNAAWDALIAHAQRETELEGTVWIVGRMPAADVRQRLAVLLNAQIIGLVPGQDACIQRLAQEPAYSQHLPELRQAVIAWHQAYEASDGERLITNA